MKRFACLLALLLSVASMVALAQEKIDPATYPLPLQKAGVVFLSNSGMYNFSEEDADQFYRNFYAELKASEGVTLTNDPSKADLILEVDIKPDSVLSQLKIRDRQTQTLLWTINERVQTSPLHKSSLKNMNGALHSLAVKFSDLLRSARSAAHP